MTCLPFHLAFPVNDLSEARNFYGRMLGCKEGRSDVRWVDFDFFGHQLVAHLDESMPGSNSSNAVDGHDVPVPHFGAILEWNDWHALADRLRKAGAAFVIEPYVRFQGKPGEQATMFLLDPAGNALEFKSFKDPAKLFATEL